MLRPMAGQTAVVVIASLLAGGLAFAAGRGGGGARVSGAARTSVNRSANVNRDVNSNVNVNRNANVNRNVDVNRGVNRDINGDRDVDIDVDRRYGDLGDGCCYRPGAAAAVATAAAVTTAAVVGSVVHTLPTSCQAVSINDLTYQQCGSTWYQPEFTGSTVNYIVVNPPR